MAIEFITKFSPQRLCRAALLIVALGWPAAAVQAHPTPFSYLDLRLSHESGGQLEGTLVVHVIDLAHDLNVEPAAKLLAPALVESKRDDILSLLRSRLLLTADGQSLDPELLSVEPLIEREAIALNLRFHTRAAP